MNDVGASEVRTPPPKVPKAQLKPFDFVATVCEHELRAPCQCAPVLPNAFRSALRIPKAPRKLPQGLPEDLKPFHKAIQKPSSHKPIKPSVA